jgi:hypothetical protein
MVFLEVLWADYQARLPALEEGECSNTPIQAIFASALYARS